jgi:hypothetical protein
MLVKLAWRVCGYLTVCLAILQRVSPGFIVHKASYGPGLQNVVRVARGEGQRPEAKASDSAPSRWRTIAIGVIYSQRFHLSGLGGRSSGNFGIVFFAAFGLALSRKNSLRYPVRNFLHRWAVFRGDSPT